MFLLAGLGGGDTIRAMDTKLFLTTFFLIFLAELGDKTQLAAMAQSVTGGKWTVFFAASSALVLSTLLAVLLGDALTAIIPERYLKMAAGILFLFFGTLLLWNALRAPSEAAAPTEENKESLPAYREGPFGKLVLDLAVAFEESAAKDYRLLANRPGAERLRPLFLALAEEERQHVRDLGEARIHAHDPAPWGTLPSLEELAHNVAREERPLLLHAIEHEEATAAFYEAVAQKAHLPPLKGVFHTLATAERRHAERLRHAIEEEATQTRGAFDSIGSKG